MVIFMSLQVHSAIVSKLLLYNSKTIVYYTNF